MIESPLRPTAYCLLPWSDALRQSVPCGSAGCVWGVHRQVHGQDDQCLFVHDAPGGAVSMTEIPIEWLEDIEVDIWGTHVKPWIERLHREEPA